jgi:PTH1 family peptidyl-tRNA hydrolase
VPLEDMLIVVDDFDLPFGKLRLRAEGSAGTHNGLRSIVAEMGTQQWARLRVGIGVGADGHGGSARDHVLTPFSSLEERQLPEVLDAAADAVETWAIDGPRRAADRFNAWKPAAPEPEPAGSGGPDPAPVADERAPDATGIVRTARGWRRLLGRGGGGGP